MLCFFSFQHTFVEPKTTNTFSEVKSSVFSKPISGNPIVSYEIELVWNDNGRPDRPPQNMALEVIVAEDSILSWWASPQVWHYARNVSRDFLTFHDENKNHITIEDGETQTFSGSFVIADSWVGDNLKIIAIVQDLDAYEVFQSEIASVLRDLDQDVDDDGIPNTQDNCPEVHNVTQDDLDGDDIGDVIFASDSYFWKNLPF